jgi:hypothetical protein
MVVRAVAALLVLAATAMARPTVGEILDSLDWKHRMTTDVRANVVLTQQKAGQGTKVLQMMYYRRDADDAFLIALTGPEAEKGNGYLRMGDNFWMYRRNTRTFQHINRDESIGGSDARGDDFEERRLTEMYAPEQDSGGGLREERLGQIDVYRFALRAKVSDVDYPRKTYWVRRDNFLVLKEESYSLNGTLMQTTYFLKYTEIKQRFVPVKQIFIDEFEKGNKTVLELANISIDKLDDAIFTKAYLENLSK